MTTPTFLEAAQSILSAGPSLNARNLADALAAIYEAGVASLNLGTVTIPTPVDLHGD